MRKRVYYCGLAHPHTLSSLYLPSTLDVTHVIKSPRPSSCFFMSRGSKVMRNKCTKRGGLGNEAMPSLHRESTVFQGLSVDVGGKIVCTHKDKELQCYTVVPSMLRHCNVQMSYCMKLSFDKIRLYTYNKQYIHSIRHVYIH